MSESAHGAAWRHLRPGEPEPRMRGRFRTHVLLSENPGAIDTLVGAMAALANGSAGAPVGGGDSDALLAVVHDEIRRRGLQPPRTFWRMLDIVSRRARTEDTWTPRGLTELAGDEEFGYLWRTVRIRCEWCDGYLVSRRRRDRKYKFAGCSNYMTDECRFTLSSNGYVRRKANVVLCLLAGEEPADGYLRVTARPRAAKKRRTPES